MFQNSKITARVVLESLIWEFKFEAVNLRVISFACYVTRRQELMWRSGTYPTSICLLTAFKLYVDQGQRRSFINIYININGTKGKYFNYNYTTNIRILIVFTGF